jgi:hypothetical protein
MNIAEIVLLSFVMSLIESFRDKKFYFKIFIKSFLIYFIGVLILNQLLDKFVPNEMIEKYSEKYGLWIFGGFLLLFSIFLSIRGFFKR